MEIKSLQKENTCTVHSELCVQTPLSRYTLVNQRHVLVLQCFKSVSCRACLMYDPAKSAKGYTRYSVARRRPVSVSFLFRASNVSGAIYGCTTSMYHQSQFTVYSQPGVGCFYIFIIYIARLFSLSKAQDRNLQTRDSEIQNHKSFVQSK